MNIREKSQQIKSLFEEMEISENINIFNLNLKKDFRGKGTIGNENV